MIACIPRWRAVACATLMAITLAPRAAIAQNTLSLAQASQLAVANQPSLNAWQWRLQAGQATRQSAALRPAYRVGLDAENLLGDGTNKGVDEAEVSLSLASVLELGGQRNARLQLADAELSALELAQQSALLDLLGEVSRRFVAALVAQQQLALLQDARTLAAASLKAMKKRVTQGASGQADLWQANAELAQAEIAEHKMQAQLSSRRMALASLWGDAVPTFDQLVGKLTAIVSADNFDTLFQRVQAAPASQHLAQAERVQKARIALLQSQSRGSIDWQLGVRHERRDNSNSATLGISIPLASGARNRSALLAAKHNSLAIEADNQARLQELRRTLFAAWQAQRSAAAAVARLQQDVIPALAKALTLTQSGWRKGRYSYRELLLARQALIDARFSLLANAQTAHLNQIMIDELTAVALTDSTVD